MMVAEFSFFKKYNHQIQHLGWAFEHKFCPEGGTLNKPISSEEKGEGVGRKLQIDQCINNKKTNKQTNKILDEIYSTNILWKFNVIKIMTESGPNNQTHFIK